jgi:hypothetical protein
MSPPALPPSVKSKLCSVVSVPVVVILKIVPQPSAKEGDHLSKRDKE